MINIWLLMDTDSLFFITSDNYKIFNDTISIIFEYISTGII